MSMDRPSVPVTFRQLCDELETTARGALSADHGYHTGDEASAAYRSATKPEIVLELVDKLRTYRRALERMRDFDASKKAGYLDEWCEAEAFRAVRRIAGDALDPAARDARVGQEEAIRVADRRRVGALTRGQRYFYSDFAGDTKNGAWVRFLKGDAEREGIVHVEVRQSAQLTAPSERQDRDARGQPSGRARPADRAANVMSAADNLDEAMVLVRCAPDREFQRKEIHGILRDRVRPAIERLEAERDGWRAIANELLKVAAGEDAAEFELPPIELVENAAGFAPALQKFWADLIGARAAERRRTFEHVINTDPIVQAAIADRVGALSAEQEYPARWPGRPSRGPDAELQPSDRAADRAGPAVGSGR
jgi:hypothetical protein